MKKIIAFNGSARKNGNTSHLLHSFIEELNDTEAKTQSFYAHEINLDYCTGCLRCNLIKRCSIRGDDWDSISREILDSDILVFATPVYFHHVTGQLKKLIDRFRSFVHVSITETGLKHTPHTFWKKDFVLLLTLGSSSDEDAQPVIELFRYMVKILGPENRLHTVTATRLGVSNQVIKTMPELESLYPKLGLPLDLVEKDYYKNRQILEKCRNMGASLASE